MVVLRVATWNVNGLRSYIFDHLPSSKYDLKTEIHPESNLAELIREWSPNLICFQETRCGTELLQKIQLPEWKLYNSSSQGIGARSQDRYSGVATLVHQSLGSPLLEESILSLAEGVEANCQSEGRFLALIFPKFVILNTSDKYLQVWNIQIKNLEAQLFTPLFCVVKGLRPLQPWRGFAPAPHHGLRPWTPLLFWY